jgi:hypothetical protein
MIRIVVGAPAKTGFFPYRIDGHWGPDGCPLIGIAEDPVAEACRVLEALGVPYGTRIAIDHGGGHISHHRVRSLSAPGAPKALPAPRRPRKRVMQVRGSGVPGDG